MPQIPPSDPKRLERYHHGNLRAALLEAAEAELVEHGIEGFSLRGVAKRAGVSHAAPAHHFRDANGLLTALAAGGFGRFVAMQTARQAQTVATDVEQFVAAGLGYIDFATTHPALFRLMFSSNRLSYDQTDLHAAANTAITKLIGDVRIARGQAVSDAPLDPATARDVMAAWAIAHGLADLMLAGRAQFLLELGHADRDTMFAEILRRALN